MVDVKAAKHGDNKKKHSPEQLAKSRLERLRDQAGHTGHSSPPVSRRERRNRSPLHDPILAHRGSIAHQTSTGQLYVQCTEGNAVGLPLRWF